MHTLRFLPDGYFIHYQVVNLKSGGRTVIYFDDPWAGKLQNTHLVLYLC